MIKGWTEVRVGDLGRVVTGKTPPTSEERYFGGEYKFISPKDMDFDSRYIRSSLTSITQEAIEKFKNQVIPKDTVMFTALSYGFGKIGLAESTCLTNQQINSIVVDELNYDFNYVYYLLRSSKEYFLTFNAGIVTPIVPKSTFEKIKILVPKKKSTQQKIAHILSAYDDLIENNLKRIKLLEEMAQITYEQWFVRMKFPGHETTPIDAETGLPEGWREGAISEVSDVNACSITKKTAPETIHYIDIASVNTGDYESPAILEFATAPSRARRKVGIGDTIFSTVRPNRKVYSFVYEDNPLLVVSTGFATLTPKLKGACSFVYLTVANQSFVDKAVSVAGGAAYPAVNQSDFEKIKVCIPNNKLIRKFSDKCNASFEIIGKLRKQNQLLKEARNILLPRLMTGMIDVDQIELPDDVGSWKDRDVTSQNLRKKAWKQAPRTPDSTEAS